MAVRYVTVISGVFFLLALLLPGRLMGIFTSEPELICIGAEYLQIVSFSYLFAFAYNTIITCGVFPAGGDSMYDAISVFFATWCFAIPLALLGCFVFHWPVMPVYAVMCLDEIVKVPFISRRYHKFLWLKNLTRETGIPT